MALAFARVTAAGQDRVVFRTDAGETISLDAGEAAALRASGLSPGARVRLTLIGGRVTAIKAVQDIGSPALPPPSSGSTSADLLGATALQPGSDLIWREGTVRDIGRYRGLVEDERNAPSHFFVARFEGLALELGDQVLYATRPASDEIEDMRVIARAVTGVGSENPCEGDLEALLAGSQSASIKAIVRSLCANRQLAWYWRTPGTPEHSELAASHLSNTLLGVLREASPGMERLYRHQVDALAALKNGQDVVVLTPTASGKTNCYNPAVFEALMGDPSATALYVFPLNALLSDQLAKLEQLQRGAATAGHTIRIAKLLGGLEKDERDEVVRHPPQIIVTNPEMLSFLLARYEQGGLRAFFQRLRFVVLDEAHFYRGIFGLHMAGIIRRLRLACQRAGNAEPGPRFVLSSATVGRPEDLATRLTGFERKRFHLITRRDNGRPDPQRHWLMLDPYGGGVSSHAAHVEKAANVLAEALLLQEGKPIRAILFVRSFRELRMAKRLVDGLLRDRGRADLARLVDTYAGALLSYGEKAERFGRFKRGELRALIATNALEAGIDLGDLDVCILAGFPYHVMRMRQMAGRAGRRNEGAVIFVPDLDRSVDRYYADKPLRLMTQPEESFVIDADNPYVARRHLAEACASFSGGLSPRELEIFGRHRDRILTEGEQSNVVERRGSDAFHALWNRPPSWDVSRIRGAEQDPWVICSAPAGERACVERGCRAAAMKNGTESSTRCENLIQLLDRQYVYREAHPGAVFESMDGDLFRCESLDESTKRVFARPMAENALERTFPLEEVSVRFGRDSARRELQDGAALVWGEATVTRTYLGYGEYRLIPKRRCLRCGSVHLSAATCPECGRRTVPFLDRSEAEYVTFESPFSLPLETIACRLELPAQIEDRLSAAAPCPIRGPEHKVAEFLDARPPYKDAPDLAKASGLSAPAAAIAFDYYTTWSPQKQAWRRDAKRSALFPASYGQCLCHALREKLPEDQALSAFQTATGYPAVTDPRHICRKCFGGILLLAAHTLEHIVTSAYPTIALGDGQDIGSTTSVIHAGTGKTTIAWYDTIEGGIGAAEKIYEQFETLIGRSENGLECECRSDRGCPRCIHVPRCDRDNEGLSKVAAINLTRVMLGMPPFISDEAEFVSEPKAREQKAEAEKAERAARDVPRPGEASTAKINPFELLRVQPHVHDAVLNRALETRGEEISAESPPVPIRALQEAYEQVKKSPRPARWKFEPAWDAWQTLHVLKSASRRLTQRAYRAIALVIHPDQYPGDKQEATTMFRRVNEAWERIKKEFERGKSG